GKTNGDGEIEHFIPGETATGQLILSNGQEIYPLRVGALNPIDTISGVQQRLNNLGYMGGSENGDLNDALTEALKKFQSEYKLEESGEINSATKAKLEEIAK
ncbi:MAG: peptidoglycan-binding protein, partial [Acidobacteriota bacterium]|nr:peptidoglycan-binding protein [Acidobacteriota bacterium]